MAKEGYNIILKKKTQLSYVTYFARWKMAIHAKKGKEK